MDTSLIIGCLKWLFPATFGSCIAVYYKAKEIGWKSIPKEEKLKTALLGVGFVVVGVFVAYMLGGVIIEVWEMDTETKVVFAVYAISGLSGFKLVDAVVRNTDKWIDKIVDTASTILDTVLDKFSKWWS